jgi:carbamoyltransferase
MDRRDHEARTVLGINAAYHQPSACLVRNGNVVAAVEEERFSRIKGGKEADVDNTLVLPFRSIEYVLRAGEVSLADVDLIGTSFSPERRARYEDLWSRIPPVLKGSYETPEGDRAFRGLMALMPDVLAARYGADAHSIRMRFRWVPHHLSHLASAYYASPFPTAAGLVIDGIGESDTTTLGDCAPDGIRILETIDYPDSLGFVWEVLTNFLGFQGNYDESKIMGLAAYGSPEVHRRAIESLITIEFDGRFRTHLDSSVLDGDYSWLERLFGFARRLPYEPLAWEGADRKHANLAAALQEKTNEVFLRLATRLRTETARSHLVMAGGVALNCVANGLVAEQCGFEDVYVQPAAGDAGSAVGAALHLAFSEANHTRPSCGAMPSPYLGPSYSNEEIEDALRRHRLPYTRVTDPIGEAATRLANGEIVGWFQSAIEFGPRALGNRSLLANPSSPTIRHVMNLQVKHREDFRPYCPTLLAEYASEWLEHDRPFCYASRNMLATYRIRAERRGDVPAIIHLDGSSRVQILHRDDNPLYYDLIQAFHRLTGIPMLLNTSFNDREPIVCSPEHACQTYLKTRFDAMFLGSFLVNGPKPWERKPQLSDFDLDARHFDSFSSRGSILDGSQS